MGLSILDHIKNDVANDRFQGLAAKAKSNTVVLLKPQMGGRDSRMSSSHIRGKKFECLLSAARRISCKGWIGCAQTMAAAAYPTNPAPRYCDDDTVQRLPDRDDSVALHTGKPNRPRVTWSRCAGIPSPDLCHYELVKYLPDGIVLVVYPVQPVLQGRVLAFKLAHLFCR